MGRYVMASPKTAIALPFSIDSYGKVNSTVDPSKIWGDRVRSVIGTAVRERVMRPLFGTEIPYTIFDTQEDARDRIKDQTTKAFASQLSALKLDMVEVTFDTYDSIMSVFIKYSLPNQEQASTTVIIGRVSIAGTNPIYEEYL
jgi:phage baseplate assembly protein W